MSRPATLNARINRFSRDVRDRAREWLNNADRDEACGTYEEALLAACEDIEAIDAEADAREAQVAAVNPAKAGAMAARRDDANRASAERGRK